MLFISHVNTLHNGFLHCLGQLEHGLEGMQKSIQLQCCLIVGKPMLRPKAQALGPAVSQPGHGPGYHGARALKLKCIFKKRSGADSGQNLTNVTCVRMIF